MPILLQSDSVIIREVWADNLEEEFALIRDIVDDYPYIGMDTVFLGVVVKPMVNFKTASELNYDTLKSNVDMLNLIQLGLTFSDEDGNMPRCGTDKYCIWQFNFDKDMHAMDSIEPLKRSGIDFKKNFEKGIDALAFGELLMSSGVVLNDDVQWVTFRSRYDFGYLLKLLTGKQLPPTPAGFYELLNMYFPIVYDMKYMMKFCNRLHGGLDTLAGSLRVKRIGVCSKAGSDSLLTSCAFKELKERYFNGSTEKYAGVLYGCEFGKGHGVR